VCHIKNKFNERRINIGSTCINDFHILLISIDGTLTEKGFRLFYIVILYLGENLLPLLLEKQKELVGIPTRGTETILGMRGHYERKSN
jgi:hypothetical protein